MEILVTGASGYIGSTLIPRLAADGHGVRAFARDAARVQAAVPVHTGDLVTGEGLDDALRGCEAAYFLVHSMEPGEESFSSRDRRAAEAFAAAARRAGTRRVVYLGGLVPADAQPVAAPGQPPGGRAGPARRGARGRGAARLDRHRRAFALVSLPRADRRAPPRPRAARLARQPHAADRRPRRDRVPRARGGRARGGRTLARHRRAGRPELRRDDRADPRPHARRPPVVARPGPPPPESPAGSAR